MKIKQSFVTNSSSASYLVFIPNNIDIVQELTEVYNKLEEWYPSAYGHIDAEVRKNSSLPGSISILKELIDIGSGYYDIECGEDYSHFPVLDWMEVKGYILKGDVGGVSNITVENIGKYSDEILQILLEEKT